MHVFGLYSFCFVFHHVSSSFYSGIVQETNRFSADFVLFISPCSEGNFEVDSLIQELYESGNTSGFIISLSNDGATSDRIAFKPLLVVVSLCPENMNIMLFALEDSFKGFKMLKMIFIAMCPLKTETHIVKLNIFNWCWKNGVVDVIIIFQGENGRIGGIWTYNPFPKISPFELKNNLTYQELFPGKFENVMGYAVNIMLPSASELLENVSIEPIIITQFIEKLNGSWVETTMHLPNSIQIRQADLDPVFYEVGFGPIQPIPFIPLSTSFIPSSSNTGLCLIVPKSRIRRDAYLNNARMILIWGAVVAASMLLVKFIIESRILKSWVTEMQSIRDSMAGRKLQPFTAEHRGRVCRLRMEVVLCSVGIIVINLYVAYITSEVTTFQLNQDINSIEDLRRRGLKVMIPREIWIPPYELQEWHDILLKTSIKSFRSHVTALNDSYGYFIQSEHLPIIMRFQEIVGKVVYKDMKLCRSTMGSKAFLISKDSPFLEVLLKFLRDIIESGLIEKWRSNAVLGMGFILKRNYFRKVDISTENGKIDANHDVRLLVSLMFGGTIISLGVFVLECLIHRCKLHK